MSRNYFGGDPRRFTYSIRMINEHLYKTFYHKIFEFNMQLPEAFNQLPALYEDGIFPQLSSIIARYSLGNDNESKVNKRLASVVKSRLMSILFLILC